MKFSIIILVIALLIGCSNAEKSLSLATLVELQKADPVKDAKYSLSQSDLRFIAVHNHDLIMPLNIQACLVERFKYRILTNQPYDYGSYDYQRYGALATLYANWYNFTILSYVQANGLSTCTKTKNEPTE